MYRCPAADATCLPQAPPPRRSILALGRFSILQAEHNWHIAGLNPAARVSRQHAGAPGSCQWRVRRMFTRQWRL